MPAARRRATTAALVLAATVLGGCNDDGRTLQPAPEVPDVPLTASTTTTTTAADAPFSLSSSDVETGGLLDGTFTCDGINVPPELLIVGVPPGTAELAVSMVDLDVPADPGGFVHWVVAGLPPSTTRIASGTSPPGAVVARTDTGVLGWDGPCPPPEDAAHRYRFRVYATAEPVGLAPELAGDEAIRILDQAATETADLVVRYQRAG